MRNRSGGAKPVNSSVITAAVDWCSRTVVHRRVAIGWAVVALTTVGLYGNLHLKIDDQPRELFKRNDADFARLQEYFRDFGPDDNDLLVVLQGPDLFSNEAVRTIWELVPALAAMEDVAHVNSIVSIRRLGSRFAPLYPTRPTSAQRLEQARRAALEHPLVANQLLSPDGKTMLLVVTLAGEVVLMSEIEAAVDRITTRVDHCLTGTTLIARFAGHPAIRVDLINNTRRERARFTVLSALIAAIIAMALFRRIAAVLICVAGPVTGVIWTMGFLGLVGETVNVLGAIVPSLIFVIGYTDAVHLMVHMRRSLGRGATPRCAAQSAVRDLGLACALTSLTTGIAFASLQLAELDVIRRFGFACATGALLNYIAVITVVPLLAAGRIGRRIGVHSPAAADVRDRVLSRWFEPVLDHPRTVVAITVTMSIVLGVESSQLRPDIRWTESLPDSSETKQVIALCDDEFGGSLPAQVVVQWPQSEDLASPRVLTVVRQVHDVLKREVSTSSPFSVLNLAASFPRGGTWTSQLRRVPDHIRHRLLRSDLRRLVVTVRIPDVGAAELEPSFRRIEKQLAWLQVTHDGYQFDLTGTSVVAARNVYRMIGDLARSLTLTGVLVFFVMSIVFRSIKTGLITILPNGFPLLLTSGLIAVSGEPLRIVSVLTFSLCLGIAVDDTIHFLVRYHQERQLGLDPRAAILRTVRVVGTALMMTTVILVGGFAVVLISEVPPLREFSLLSCVALKCRASGRPGGLARPVIAG